MRTTKDMALQALTDFLKSTSVRGVCEPKSFTTPSPRVYDLQILQIDDAISFSCSFPLNGDHRAGAPNKKTSSLEESGWLSPAH